MPGQTLSDLGAIIGALDGMGRLIRVRSEVDPRLDLAAIAARFEGGPAAVLFENVKGHRQPVFTGLYWSRELLAELAGQEENRCRPGSRAASATGSKIRWRRGSSKAAR